MVSLAVDLGAARRVQRARRGRREERPVTRGRELDGRRRRAAASLVRCARRRTERQVLRAAPSGQTRSRSGLVGVVLARGGSAAGSPPPPRPPPPTVHPSEHADPSRCRTQSLAVDLLNPSAEQTAKTHKLKRLVQCVLLLSCSPPQRSTTDALPSTQVAQLVLHGRQGASPRPAPHLDPLLPPPPPPRPTRTLTPPPLSRAQCPGCFNITTVFSHAQTVVLCGSCSTILCAPTGGRAKLTEGASHLSLSSSLPLALADGIS